MEYVQPAVETLKPYDLSASKLIKGFGLAGTIGALLLGFVLVLAIKLRLLSKIGYYLGSVRTFSTGNSFFYQYPFYSGLCCDTVWIQIVTFVRTQRTQFYQTISRLESVFWLWAQPCCSTPRSSSSATPLSWQVGQTFIT